MALHRLTVVLQGGVDLGRLPFILGLAVLLVVSAGAWKTFTKANQPGWALFVPFYNVYVMLEIGANDWWWLLVLFVPVANVYAAYKICAGVARAFGQGPWVALGLLLLVCWPLLGFGGYSYQGSGEDVLDDRLEEALDASNEDVF